jgi:hypothetical protein
MGKYSNAFFSETTNMIKAKLYMNVHWMVLYKLYVFCSDMKLKMAATAGLSLTWDPEIRKNYGKIVMVGIYDTMTCGGSHLGKIGTTISPRIFFSCLMKLIREHYAYCKYCKQDLSIQHGGRDEHTYTTKQFKTKVPSQGWHLWE